MWFCNNNGILSNAQGSNKQRRGYDIFMTPKGLDTRRMF